jgi:Tfp pilus assembly protein PilN
MSPLIGLLVVWGVLTAILIILLIYRSTLTMHEDDQLFLNESDTHMEQEQAEVLSKVNKIGPYVKVLGAVSGVLILVIAGIYLYQGLSNTLP